LSISSRHVSNASVLSPVCWPIITQPRARCQKVDIKQTKFFHVLRLSPTSPPHAERFECMFVYTDYPLPIPKKSVISRCGSFPIYCMKHLICHGDRSAVSRVALSDCQPPKLCAKGLCSVFPPTASQIHARMLSPEHDPRPLEYSLSEQRYRGKPGESTWPSSLPRITAPCGRALSIRTPPAAYTLICEVSGAVRCSLLNLRPRFE
jgi:hypothetical protein